VILGGTVFGNLPIPPGVAPAAYDGLVIDYTNFWMLWDAIAPYDKGRTANP